ncbi:Uncharacterized protein FWK35_00035931, partial [Aphis craccivora]
AGRAAGDGGRQTVLHSDWVTKPILSAAQVRRAYLKLRREVAQAAPHTQNDTDSGTSTPRVAVWGGSMTRYATAASTKYRHRSDRSTPLSTAITDDDKTVLSTLPPTPQRLGGTGRQVTPNEYRPPAIVLSCVNRRTAYTKSSTTLRKQNGTTTLLVLFSFLSFFVFFFFVYNKTNTHTSV